MNSDRSIDELLKVFGVLNLSNLGSDIIIKFFDDISVKEVMKLCRVNKQFNTVCQKDFMWRRKVKNDYGIETKYGRTWKETAQLLFETNMININERWVNGKTYKELFDEGLEGKDYFKDLYDKHDLIKTVFPTYVTNIGTAKEFLMNDDDSPIGWVGNVPSEYLTLFNSLNKHILDDKSRLQKQISMMTREFSVVAHAVAEIIGTYSDYNFGLASLASEKISFEQGEDVSRQVDEHSSPKQSEITRRLSKIIDPNLYIMTYSFMSLYNLSEINVWE
uniref:F-box domain-containing protein n=1 Tax=Pithovirus LCPAC401 TaxID=2506595 RepID=A0A481ZCJ0_9VIRU|nr:MAG: uncharacterized protein LCPAC401_04880 [Pithovirus LCPAC401]